MLLNYHIGLLFCKDGGFNITINVVIQQNSRKLLVMDILMYETC